MQRDGAFMNRMNFRKQSSRQSPSHSLLMVITPCVSSVRVNACLPFALLSQDTPRGVSTRRRTWPKNWQLCVMTKAME